MVYILETFLVVLMSLAISRLVLVSFFHLF